MYIHIKTAYKCSICGTIDNYEMVTLKDETFRRCLSCGHEKLFSTTRTTSTKNKWEHTIYNNINKKPIEF